MAYTDPFNGHKNIDDQHRYKEQNQPVPPVPPVPPMGYTYIVSTLPLINDEWLAQLVNGYLYLSELKIRPDLFIGLFRNSLKLKIDNPDQNVFYLSPSGNVEVDKATSYIRGIRLFERPEDPLEPEAESWELLYLYMLLN